MFLNSPSLAIGACTLLTILGFNVTGAPKQESNEPCAPVCAKKITTCPQAMVVEQPLLPDVLPNDPAVSDVTTALVGETTIVPKLTLLQPAPAAGGDDPPAVGPKFSLRPNRKRPGGGYLGYVRYCRGNVEFDWELQTADRDIKVAMDDVLPDELTDYPPVLMGQAVATDGNKQIPLGLQFSLGQGTVDNKTLRFPLYVMVKGAYKAAAAVELLEQRIESPFLGLPPSFKAKSVTVELWVQFNLHRYKVNKPITIQLSESNCAK